MKRWLVACGVAGVMVMAAGSASAQDGIPEIEISPTEGGPGTEIQVSGSDCPPGDWGDANWSVHLRGDGSPEDMTGSIQEPVDDGEETLSVVQLDDTVPIGAASTSVDENGDWAVTLTVISGEDAIPGEYVITATCMGEFVEQGILHYATPVTFEVLGEPEPEPEPEPGPAPEPMPSEPRFTG